MAAEAATECLPFSLPDGAAEGAAAQPEAVPPARDRKEAGRVLSSACPPPRSVTQGAGQPTASDADGGSRARPGAGPARPGVLYVRKAARLYVPLQPHRSRVLFHFCNVKMGGRKYFVIFYMNPNRN